LLYSGLPKFMAKQNPFRDQPASAVPEPEEAAVKTAAGEKGCWYRNLAAKVGLQRSAAASAPALARPPASAGTPTQCELSLDQVKVVRNDLSDTDFEVVARRGKKAERKPAPTADGPDSAWGRVSLRIFGAGKAS
jgi:hypothetical protein